MEEEEEEEDEVFAEDKMTFAGNNATVCINHETTAAPLREAQDKLHRSAAEHAMVRDSSLGFFCTTSLQFPVAYSSTSTIVVFFIAL